VKENEEQQSDKDKETTNYTCMGSNKKKLLSEVVEQNFMLDLDHLQHIASGISN
jgi:hypothetical protein